MKACVLAAMIGVGAVPAGAGTLCRAPAPGAEVLRIEGADGAFSYASWRGERVTLGDLRCAALAAGPGVVCLRPHSRPEGLTVGLYHLDRTEGPALLTITEFVEKAGADPVLPGQPHQAQVRQIVLWCGPAA